jgi:hypothetical protein
MEIILIYKNIRIRQHDSPFGKRTEFMLIHGDYFETLSPLDERVREAIEVLRNYKFEY